MKEGSLIIRLTVKTGGRPDQKPVYQGWDITGEKWHSLL
jgi:hypothetical protein